MKTKTTELNTSRQFSLASKFPISASQGLCSHLSREKMIFLLLERGYVIERFTISTDQVRFPADHYRALRATLLLSIVRLNSKNSF